jgi:hypothetical protein
MPSARLRSADGRPTKMDLQTPLEQMEFFSCVLFLLTRGDDSLTLMRVAQADAAQLSRPERFNRWDGESAAPVSPLPSASSTTTLANASLHELCGIYRVRS